MQRTTDSGLSPAMVFEYIIGAESVGVPIAHAKGMTVFPIKAKEVTKEELSYYFRYGLKQSLNDAKAKHDNAVPVDTVMATVLERATKVRAGRVSERSVDPASRLLAKVRGILISACGVKTKALPDMATCEKVAKEKGLSWAKVSAKAEALIKMDERNAAERRAMIADLS